MTDRAIIDHHIRIFDLSGDVTLTQAHLGFQGVGPGWLPILERLCARLQVIAGPEFKFTSVKEKMGTLRVSYRGGDDEVAMVVAAAKAEALVTCMSCGAAGDLTEVEGWWAVRCGRCAAAVTSPSKRSSDGPA
jgi:hypothetical protein